jgi:hypothetical protein
MAAGGDLPPLCLAFRTHTRTRASPHLLLWLLDLEIAAANQVESGRRLRGRRDDNRPPGARSSARAWGARAPPSRLQGAPTLWPAGPVDRRAPTDFLVSTRGLLFVPVPAASSPLALASLPGKQSGPALRTGDAGQASRSARSVATCRRISGTVVPNWARPECISAAALIGQRPC